MTHFDLDQYACYFSMRMENEQPAKEKLLEGLRARYASGGRVAKTVFARLTRMKNNGRITEAEYNYVLGITISPSKTPDDT